MDVILWILIGLAGGLTVAALAPQMGLPTRSAAAPRRVRGMATGLVGAVAAGSALVLADPAVRADRLTAGVGRSPGRSGLRGSSTCTHRAAAGVRAAGRRPWSMVVPSARSRFPRTTQCDRRSWTDSSRTLWRMRQGGTRRSADSSPPFVTAHHARACHGTRGFSSRCASGTGGPRRATSVGARARPSSRSRWRTGRGMRERSRSISRWTAIPWTPRLSVDSPT